MSGSSALNERIGFIGLGAMGRGMAANLAAKSFPLTVLGRRDRSVVEALLAKGASEALSPADLAARVDIVILCVPGSPDVEAIAEGAEGLLGAVQPGQVVIDCSTSEPASTGRLAAAFAAKRVPFVDAPLARTPKEAAEGRLNIMVGAEPSVFDRVRPVLAAFGENIFHVGGPGAGHKTKLVNNFLTMGQAAMIAEALVAAARAGLDVASFIKVVAAGGANSGIFQMVAPSALAGTYDGLNFGLDLARKDLRYYTHLTEALNLPSALGEAVHQAFVQASAMGLGGERVGALVKAQERFAAMSVRGEPISRIME